MLRKSLIALVFPSLVACGGGIAPSEEWSPAPPVVGDAGVNPGLPWQSPKPKQDDVVAPPESVGTPPAGIPLVANEKIYSVPDSRALLQGVQLDKARSELTRVNLSNFVGNNKKENFDALIQKRFDSRSAVFVLHSFPDLIFKLTQDDSGRFMSASERAKKTYRVQKVLNFYKNPGFLKLPKSQVVSVSYNNYVTLSAGTDAIVEEKLDLEAGYYPQQELYEAAYEEFATNPALKERFLHMFEWLAKLASVTGFYDIRWANIPLMRDRQAIALVDLEEMDHPYFGLSDLLLIAHPDFYDAILEVFRKDRVGTGNAFRTIKDFKLLVSANDYTYSSERWREDPNYKGICDHYILVPEASTNDQPTACFDTVEDAKKERAEKLKLHRNARAWYASNSIDDVKLKAGQLQTDVYSFSVGYGVADMVVKLARRVEERASYVLAQPATRAPRNSPGVRTTRAAVGYGGTEAAAAKILKANGVIYDFREIKLTESISGYSNRVIELQY